MSEFNLVEKATVSPTRCYFCMEFNGPFIDTYVDAPDGHIYICGPTNDRPGCVGQMIAKFGGLSISDADKLRKQLAESQEQIKELERTQRIEVNAEDLRKMLKPPPKVTAKG